jgi:hypothetical protein
MYLGVSKKSQILRKSIGYKAMQLASSYLIADKTKMGMSDSFKCSPALQRQAGILQSQPRPNLIKPEINYENKSCLDLISRSRKVDFSVFPNLNLCVFFRSMNYILGI